MKISFNSFTIVNDAQTFWTGVQSSVLFISPGVTPQPTEAPTTVPPPLDFNPYEGCGVTKVCFGGPQTGCLPRQDCDLFGAVIYENNLFTFELLSKRKFSYLVRSREF